MQLQESNSTVQASSQVTDIQRVGASEADESVEMAVPDDDNENTSEQESDNAATGK